MPRDPTEWAVRYLRRRSVDADAESVPDPVPPEAAEYREEFGGSTPLAPDDPAPRLAAAVRALVDAAADGADVRGDEVAAFVEDGRIVVVDEDHGELVDVDRETAALVAFAHALDPEADG
ncbi:MAG: hypothetical protein ABEH47_02040 [Haloferacaceae archaeon]